MYIITLITGLAGHMCVCLCANFLELEKAKYSIIVDLNGVWLAECAVVLAGKIATVRL